MTSSDRTVVLDAASGEADRIEVEAALSSLTRLGLVARWHRMADGRYRIEVEPSVVNDLSMLVRSQGPHAPAVDARTLQ